MARRALTSMTAVLAALLAGSLLAACSAAAEHPTPRPTASPAARVTPTSATTTAPTASAPPSTPAPAPTPAGGPVPAGFVPVAGAALPAGVIWLLGTAPCGSAPCTSIVRSLDGGVHWAGIPAPRAPLASAAGATGVSRIEFATARDGWAYGPQLWSTDDGGARWHALTPLPGGVIGAAVTGDGLVVALSVSGGGAVDLARVSASDTVTVTHTVAGASSGQLASSPDGSVWFAAAPPPGGGSTAVLESGDGGSTWAARTPPCSGSWALGAPSLASPGPDRLVAVCAGSGAAGSQLKRVMASADGGSTWSTAFVTTTPPPGRGIESGDLGPVAAAGSQVVLGTSSGASNLFVSASAGTAWTAATGYNPQTGGTPWTTLAFAGSGQALAVTAGAVSPQRWSGAAYLSADGGATWRALSPR